jgi:hypothetical protein
MPDHLTTLIRALPGHLRAAAIVVLGVVALIAAAWVAIRAVR